MSHRYDTHNTYGICMQIQGQYLYILCGELINSRSSICLASSPGSNAGGKRAWYPLRMCQKYNVNDITSSYVARL